MVHHISSQFNGVLQKLTFEDVSLLQLLCGGSLAEPPEKRKLCSHTFLQGLDRKWLWTRKTRVITVTLVKRGCFFLNLHPFLVLIQRLFATSSSASFCRKGQNKLQHRLFIAQHLYQYTTHNNAEEITPQLHQIYYESSHQATFSQRAECVYIWVCTWLVCSLSAGGAHVSLSLSSVAECSSPPALSCWVGSPVWCSRCLVDGS